MTASTPSSSGTTSRRSGARRRTISACSTTCACPSESSRRRSDVLRRLRSSGGRVRRSMPAAARSSAVLPSMRPADEGARHADARGTVVQGARSTRFVLSVQFERNGVLPSREARSYDGTTVPQARFFDLALDLLAVGGFDGKLRRVNPAWSQTLGWSEDELLATPFANLFHPDDLEHNLDQITQMVTGAETVWFETRLRC